MRDHYGLLEYHGLSERFFWRWHLHIPGMQCQLPMPGGTPILYRARMRDNRGPWRPSVTRHSPGWRGTGLRPAAFWPGHQANTLSAWARLRFRALPEADPISGDRYSPRCALCTGRDDTVEGVG